MRKIRIVSALVPCLTVSILAFSNCSKVAFEQAKTDTLTSIQSNPPPTTVIEDTIADCASAASSGQLKTLKTAITFDDTRVETGLANICSATTSENFDVFSNNGYNGYLASRYEQKRSLNLPSNAVICGISLDNSLSSFRYDDMIFLTFNNYVIASNYGNLVTTKLSFDEIAIAGSPLKMYKYDWLALRGGKSATPVYDYCIGADEGLGSCLWPVSEQPGNFHVDYDPKLLIALGLASTSGEQEFKFVVTGDNDAAIDCYHEELKFETTVQYFIAQ